MRASVLRRAISAVAISGVIAAVAVPTSAAAADTIDVLHDFESGDPGHIYWGSAGAGAQTLAEAGVDAYPDSGPNTRVLSYGFDLSAAGSYGGIGFEQAEGSPTLDWSGYDGVQFWLYGDGSDASFQVEIMDAVSPEPAATDRWDTVIPVGAAGWRLVRLPWEEFAYATDFQDDGAPGDGALDLEFVRGLLFPAHQGAATVKIDDIALYSSDGVVPATVGMGSTAVSAVEGTDAVVSVALSKVAESDVTVDYATADGSASAGVDYTATSGTLTIPSGTRSGQIVVPTLDDDAVNGNRDFTVTLTNPEGATAGATTTTVTVRDNDSAPASPLGLLHDVVEDFESELVLGDPAAIPALGWFTAQGAGNVPTFQRIADTTRPGAPSDNDTLELGLDSTSWAVLIDTFTPDGTTWQPQDWSDYRGVGFWMEGTNSGAPLFVDLLDNRTPDSTVDDAERFSIRFTDDFTGWRFIELPFEDFTRKNIGNGAPDDGLTLTEVHGIGIGIEQTSSTLTPTLHIDDVTLVGASDANRPLTINAARAVFTVTEGETAQVDLLLTRASDTDVTVDFRTEPATDRTSTEDLPATPDRDYVPTTGTATFAAGETSTTIEVPTIDDDKAEVDETFLVRLSDPAGADLNPLALPRVSIVDDDEAAPGLLDDFENGVGTLEPLGGAALGTREIAATDDDAYDGQSAHENVLDMVGPGGYARAFDQAQDWSDQEGFGFWFSGQGDGQPVSVTLRDDAAPATGPEGWELAWSDEFDAPAGTPADPDTWTYETGGWGWGNDELQYYTDSTENAAHDGEGNMVITVREVEDPEAAGLECWYGPCTHTSARLITENKVEVMHGRIEARAKLPDGEPGIWPAIWTLGNDFRDVGWPRTGEIDVMEYVGKLPEEIFGTIHGPGYSGGNAWGDTQDFGENLGGQWMTFAVEWEEGEIRWYVTPEGGPEMQFHSAVPADVAPSDWVYEHPFFMIMNMAVGGNFGGPLGEDLTFPQELAVDYIRVYQEPDSAERFTASFVDDTAGWRFIQLPFESFERNDDQPAGAPDNGLTLSSVNGYEVVRGAPLSVETFSGAARGFSVPAAGSARFAVPEGGVSLDAVQVLSEVSDPVDPGAEPGTDPDPDGDGGATRGTDGTDGGTDGGTDSGAGATGGAADGLAQTGGPISLALILLANVLLAAGLTAVLLSRRSEGEAGGRLAP